MLIIDYQSKSYQRFLQDVAHHVAHPKRFLIIINGASESDLIAASKDIESFSHKSLLVSAAIIEQQAANIVNALFTQAKDAKDILLFKQADSALCKNVAVKNAHAIEGDFELNNLFKNIANHKGMVILATEDPQTLSAVMSSKVDVNIRFTRPSN